MTLTTPSLRRDAAANRAALVEAARTVVAREPHASLDAIARAAGLSRRALYGHFPDRDALMTEVIRASADRFNAIAAAVDDTTDAPLALARLFTSLWREAVQVQVNAALALDETHLAQTAAALAPVRQRLLEIVVAGQGAGSLRPDVSAAQLARLIEETARTAITRFDGGSPDAGALAVKAALAIGGLGWREAEALLSAHPELGEGR